MTGQQVPEGALFYAETHRRVVVPFDADLRTLTETVVADLRGVFVSGTTPPPTTHKSRCRACSLSELCRPQLYARPVLAWRNRILREMLAPTA
jgi:CRISPR-associated exonuclease Cas4